MIVAFYFLASLAYLSFAGYGITGFLFKGQSTRQYLILVNGFCLTVLLFSESYIVLRSAQQSFILTLVACLMLNIAYVVSQPLLIRFNSRKSPQSKWRRKQFYAKISVYLLAFGIVVFVGWSFFYSGWQGFWGSANEDIFDGLYGRDAIALNQSANVASYLDPLIRYQYSSLAFWSMLLQAFDRMNVFYLQSLLMIFIQVTGIYFLCRSGFKLNHRLSFLSAFLGSTGSLYISTLFTGHEGSTIFAALIPFILGLALSALHRRRAVPGEIAAFVMFMFVVIHTYVFPLGFTLIPLVITASLSAVRYRWEMSPSFRNSLRSFVAIPPGYVGRVWWAAMALFLTMILAGLGYLLIERGWEIAGPLRIRASATYRAWAISHFKEVILIYWGILPSSIPFGSIANPAKLNIPMLLEAGYFLVAGLVLVIAVGLRHLIRQFKTTGMFFASYVVSWTIIFLFMKFFIVDSYYLYKFYYTNYFLLIIPLVIGGERLILRTHFPNFCRLEAIKKTAVVAVFGFFAIANLIYVTLYNVDIVSRRYNANELTITDLSGLAPYVTKGVFFNLPQFDMQNVLEYVFHSHGFPPPRSVARTFSYELRVKGIEDILMKEEVEDSVVWKSDYFRLLKAREHDKLIVDTYYQGEQYPEIYNDHVFRWVRDKVTLELINPANERAVLSFCVEPGPGVGYHPFWLYVFVNGTLLDSTLVGGLQSIRFEIPALFKRVNEVRFLTLEKGRNFLPWEERYLNYRVALIGISEDRYLTESMKILNAPADIIPRRSWEVLAQTSSTWKDTSDLLLIGNNWNPVEHDGPQVLRWVNNDAQLLIFNPSDESRVLKLTIEKGPALGGQEPMLEVLLNGLQIDKVALAERKSVEIALPRMNSKENIVTLRVDRTGIPVGRDPRVLNFRVLDARLVR